MPNASVCPQSRAGPIRYGLVLFVAIWLECVPLGALAQGVARLPSRAQVFVVTNDETKATESIVSDLLTRLPTAQVLTSGAKGRQKSDKNSIYIPIGPAALRSLVFQNVDGVIVAAFSSHQALMAIKEGAPRSALISGVYADPSPSTQMQLAYLLFKKTIRLGVLLSEKTARQVTGIQASASQTGHDLLVEFLEGEDSLNRSINRLTEATAILAIPDDLVYNPDNIRNILVTTYRRNQAVIGFSSALVKAGALASTVSTISDINAQITELVYSYATTGKLPEIQYPKYFNVVVNEGVARSLNILLDDSVRNFSSKPPEVLR